MTKGERAQAPSPFVVSAQPGHRGTQALPGLIVPPALLQQSRPDPILRSRPQTHAGHSSDYGFCASSCTLSLAACSGLT